MVPPVVAAPASVLASRQKFRAPPGSWKPIRSRAQQALDDLRPPGQPHEQLDGRERNVQEEPDPHVGTQPAEQLRDELQLIVVHPDRRSRCGKIGGRLANRALTCR